jgi:hypothetical protein
MRPLRKWLALAVPAALAVLVVSAVPAASTAPAATAPHGRAVAATAPQAKDAVHIVQRGLVRDCVYISNYYAGGLEIEGNGPNKAVSLNNPPASCFNLYNKFTWKGYTGYEYQDLSGHCLWSAAGVIEVGAACQANTPYEEFFGAKLYSGQGWLFSNVFTGIGSYMSSKGCSLGSGVSMVSGGDVCDLWNFPS